MKIDVLTRAMIPSRLIEEAVYESSRCALGRMQLHVHDIQATVTDRRLNPGAIRCEVEIYLAKGTSVIARSVSANPVEAVTQAFEKAARGVFKQLAKEWTKRRIGQHRPTPPMRSHSGRTEMSLHQGGVA